MPDYIPAHNADFDARKAKPARVRGEQVCVRVARPPHPRGVAWASRPQWVAWASRPQVCNPAPLDPSELTFLATHTRTPYVDAFDGADANKVAHYMLRWEYTRGEPGPWGEMASTTIGA